MNIFLPNDEILTFPEHWHILNTNTWIFYCNIYGLCECDSVKLSLRTDFLKHLNMFIMCCSVIAMLTSTDCCQVSLLISEIESTHPAVKSPSKSEIYILITRLMLIWSVVVFSFTLRFICNRNNSESVFHNAILKMYRKFQREFGRALDRGSAQRNNNGLWQEWRELLRWDTLRHLFLIIVIIHFKGVW